MGDVLQFRRREPEKQHGTGMAFCIGCGHEWVAVAEAGTTVLQCPECQAHKGKWCFEFYPASGQLVRQCNCGNQLFYMTPDGHMCANCGIYQEY